LRWNREYFINILKFLVNHTILQTRILIFTFMNQGTKIHYIFSITLLIVVMSSCFKKETYPNEPIISYDAFSISNEKANLVFNFTDGDGDIGLSDSDTIFPYDINSEFHYNLLINYYEKDDILGWVEGKNLDGTTTVFKYRIKPIITKGKTKGIKGKIDVDMGTVFYNPLSNQNDTIKYKIQLIDKTLNKSNSIETEVIIR